MLKRAITVAAIVLSGRGGFAQQPQENEAALGQYLLQAILHSREELVSGEYTAEDHFWTETADGEIKSEWHAQITCAFDKESSRLRFDYLSADDPKQGFHLIELPDGVVIHGALSSALEIIPLADASNRRPDRFFDVSLIGLLSPTETRGRRMQEVIPFFEKATLLAGQPTDDSDITRLKMVLGKNGAERHILVNEDQGNTPVHFEMRYPNPETKQFDPTPHDPVQVTWTRVSNVWVPEQMTWVVNWSNGESERREVSFIWESVNEPVPEDRFDRQTIPLKPGTVVGDSRLDPGHPIVIETIPDTSQSSNQIPERSNWWLFIISANVAVFIVIVFIAWYRRRQ